MTLGRRLVQLRSRAGLSQDALAERLGVSRQSVSKWETDTSVPDLDKLVKLGEVFDVSLDELVKGEAPQAAGTAGLWQKLTALYREKFYLLGWVLAGWGVWCLLRMAWTAVTLALPSLGLLATLNLYFIAMLPQLLTHLLKMLLGALFVLYGKGLAGRFRWYHLGWPMIGVGLFGIPAVQSLRSGLLAIPSILYYLLRNPQSPEDWEQVRMMLSSDISGSLLLGALGIFLLVYGRRKSAKENSAE